MIIEQNKDLIIALYLAGQFDKEAELVVEAQIKSNREFRQQIVETLLLHEVAVEDILRVEAKKGVQALLKEVQNPKGGVLEILLLKWVAMICTLVGVVWLLWVYLAPPQNQGNSLVVELYQASHQIGQTGIGFENEIQIPTGKKIRILNDEKENNTFEFKNDSTLHISVEKLEVIPVNKMRLVQDSSYYVLQMDSLKWYFKGKKGIISKNNPTK